VATVGEKRAPYAVLGCAFILGIPVFFDTVFFLMIPLVRALALRTGKNYVLLLLAIAAGGVATHANVPPTPGPLLVAEMLKLDLGVAIVGGIALSIGPALGALGVAGWLDRRKPIPVRPVGAAGLEAERAMASRPDHTLPGLFVSLLPLALPVVLIAGATIAAMFAKSLPPLVFSLLTIIGHKSTALAVRRELHQLRAPCVGAGGGRAGGAGLGHRRDDHGRRHHELPRSPRRLRRSPGLHHACDWFRCDHVVVDERQRLLDL
jgi:GntP family gluconate:H+ symporter